MCNKNDDKEKKKKKMRKMKMKTKARRPKYLSLSKHIKKKASEAAEITKMSPQLNLFPLHPENLVVDDRSFADENVALLFDSESAAGDASLTGLLRPSPSEHDGSPSHEPLFDDGESLVRTAMKRRHGGVGEEEKWVSYSEVVEEVTSSSSRDVVWRGKKRTRIRVRTTSSNNNSEGNSVISTGTAGLSSLTLKLDYQEILKAWSDKGPLYIQAQPNSPSPQTVPDLQYDLGLMDGWGSNAGNLWKVPENEGIKIKEELDGLKLGQREASVLRYKEKRQSRLFAKRIRYEVRKLNAEKRPRIKGRFVKIS